MTGIVGSLTSPNGVSLCRRGNSIDTKTRDRLNVFYDELSPLHRQAFELVTQLIIGLGARDDLGGTPGNVAPTILLLELRIVLCSQGIPPELIVQR